MLILGLDSSSQRVDSNGYDVSREAESPAHPHSSTRSQAPPLPDSGPTNEATRAALSRGLDWLAQVASEQSDGSVPIGSAPESAPVAITALSALAWMAGGSGLGAGNEGDAGRGPHGPALVRAVDFLLSRADGSEGSETHGYISDPGDALSRMHGHGFATLALAEAYGVSTRTTRGRRIEAALIAAIHRIEEAQHETGGWGYEPKSSLLHEGSITICIVQALRAARNSGLRVDTDVIGRAIDYVRKSQKDDGSFKYSLADERSSVALTAAAVSTLNATGDYSSPIVQSGYEYLFRQASARASGESVEASGMEWPHYERLYVAQAYWQHADAAVFTRWFEEERLKLLRAQSPDGSWESSRYGKSYATAMACLVLALPEQLLPIFQR